MKGIPSITLSPNFCTLFAGKLEIHVSSLQTKVSCISLRAAEELYKLFETDESFRRQFLESAYAYVVATTGQRPFLESPKTVLYYHTSSVSTLPHSHIVYPSLTDTLYVTVFQCNSNVINFLGGHFARSVWQCLDLACTDNFEYELSFMFLFLGTRKPIDLEKKLLNRGKSSLSRELRAQWARQVKNALCQQLGLFNDGTSSLS